MAAWNKIREMAKTANHLREKATDIKNTAENTYNNGIVSTVKDKIKSKAYRKAGKLAWQGAKTAGKFAVQTVGKFLVTPPWGWAVSAGLVVAFTMLMSGHHASDDVIDNDTGSGTVTKMQYAAMQMGCPTGNPASTSGSVDLKSGKSHWSLSQVTSFAKQSYASTWGVSNSDAADLFLTQNKTVATGYGLNKNNIGRVINAVKSEGVSPVFFFLYSVNEVGGAGGYINHYGKGAMTGNAVKDAKMDAAYLVSQSNVSPGTPATGGGEPGGMPTGAANKVLKEMPGGSIGRVYIQATSATTAELETLAGVKGGWSGKFGNSLQGVMSNITKLGGDVSKGKKAFGSKTSGGDMIDTDDSKQNQCGQTDDTSASLKSGGLTLKEAQAFMKDRYFGVKITQADIPGAAPGSPEIHDNCTAFTSFFVSHYASGLKSSSGNGGEKVENLVANNKGKLTESSTPSVYSVFSIKGGFAGTTGSEGHTGIVLGIDKARKVAILGQAGYGMAYNAHWVAEEEPLSKMTASQGWRFTSLAKYVKGLSHK